MPRIAYVSRTETFSAAHRLHSPHLSDEENAQVYGKCNHASGHGHNYTVTVLVRGRVDERTGMVVNLVNLKAHLRQNVLEPLDHHHLDLDVPYFASHPSTAENIAIFIWELLEPLVRADDPSEHGPRLHEVRVQETPANIAIYRGEEEESG
ncbi:6-pyruvoyl tetrahydrobiopterin synthase [Piptocephalis cylindrospora]|uniref:6-pyruvoyltetrahydropterin synthase n=1 Tax=Piptocephalis cylindrospora TaxID=1907219 RepID=A0A4P9Y7H7_9FUNG|nr:6-pyruvoyl tetrahydrobiopterin synthase [Piptocephalis cylindrospora]|eukprot:RKP14694.1 6-pyruvoyl tetrahydrobiopterin synthase [Piptocephalis cylindrospora]